MKGFMKLGFKITEVTAFICTEKDGTEGIIGTTTPNGWMPLIGADTKRIEALKPHALEIAKMANLPVVMARFSVRKNIEEIFEPVSP